MFDLPLEQMSPRIQERVVCSIMAAQQYNVPANIVLAVAETENGRAGQWVKNTNNTYDVGSLQFNTTYLKDLARFGITSKDVEAGGCYAFDLATWRLNRHLTLDSNGDIWTRAANYHSKTPSKNAIYRAKLIKSAHKWGKWLDIYYPTRVVDR